MHATGHCAKETGHSQGDRLIEHVGFAGGETLGEFFVTNIAHESRQKRKYKEMHKNLQRGCVYFKAILKYNCRKVNRERRRNI
jgi:hypothetical protein